MQRLPNKREFATSVEFHHWRKSSESLGLFSLLWKRRLRRSHFQSLPFFLYRGHRVESVTRKCFFMCVGCICRFRKYLHLFALHYLWKWKKQRPAHYLWCELEFAWENVATFTFLIMQFLFGYAMFALLIQEFIEDSQILLFPLLSKLISMHITA